MSVMRSLKHECLISKNCVASNRLCKSLTRRTGRAPADADARKVTSQRSTHSPLRTRASRAGALGAAALAAAALPSSAAAAPGGGTGTWVWALAAVGAAVLVFTLVRLRGGLRRATHSVSDISDGRELLIARGRRVTETLTSLADVVAEREDEGASKQHQRALDAVASARSRIGRASGPRVMAKAHEELDEAEWLIGVLGARLDGFVEPLRPARRPARRPASSTASTALATVEVDLEGIALPARPRALLRSLRRQPRARRAPARRLRVDGRPRRCPGLRRRAGAAPTPGPSKDLKHLHYDGTPLFAAPERPVGQRRQTVAERARGVRARVLPMGAGGAGGGRARRGTRGRLRRPSTRRHRARARGADAEDSSSRPRRSQHRRLRRHGGRGARPRSRRRPSRPATPSPTSSPLPGSGAAAAAR